MYARVVSISEISLRPDLVLPRCNHNVSRGPDFCNAILHMAHAEIMEFITVLSTAYHPQSSGKWSIKSCGLKRILERGHSFSKANGAKFQSELVIASSITLEGTLQLNIMEQVKMCRGYPTPHSYEVGVQTKTSLLQGSWSGYQQKDRKPSQNDKTEMDWKRLCTNQGPKSKIAKSDV
ncbi:hypothetical protein Tco_0563299 [Tanacetum coccineum]